MIFSSLRASSFRNIGFADISLSARLNCFTGANGAGKTSILEGAYVLGRSRSFRSSTLDSLIGIDDVGFSLGADCVSVGQRKSIVLKKKRGESIQLLQDTQVVQRLSEMATLLPIQLVTPEVGQLVTEGPVLRRQFLDWGLFHVKQDYVGVARDYGRVLKQRNAWLKEVGSTSRGTKDPWLKLLVPLGLSIHQAREHYSRQLFPLVVEYLRTLNDDLRLDFNYLSGWHGDTEDTLEECLEMEARQGVKFVYSRSGPHRGDIQILDRGRASSQTLSRGQSKIVAVAMHLAQAALLSKQRSEKTIVLFDELVAELDKRHVRVVFELMKSLECQVLLTAVELAPDFREEQLSQASMFHVEHGNIQQLKS